METSIQNHVQPGFHVFPEQSAVESLIPEGPSSADDFLHVETLSFEDFLLEGPSAEVSMSSSATAPNVFLMWDPVW